MSFLNLFKNYHFVVLFATLVNWILYKMYGKSVEYKIKHPKEEPSSNFVYILYLPVLLYIIYFFFVNKNPSNIVVPNVTVQMPSAPIKPVSDILSVPYPPSSSI